MNIIDNDGVILDHIYTTHDRFLEDLDHYISKNFCFSVFVDDTIDILDCICGHLLYWQYKTYSDDFQAKIIYDGLFKQNGIIQRLIKIGDSIPELVIYEFNGTSLYCCFNEDDIEYVANSKTFFAMLEGNSKLYFTQVEFEEMGGEITLPVDEEDELCIEFSSYSNVYFFMKNEDLINMKDYLNKCVLELNNIYLSLGMRVIEQIVK